MITLSLISQIVIAGASVMFAPVETSTPPVQYYNEMTNTITPCNTSIQDNGTFTYCEVQKNDWIVFAQNAKADHSQGTISLGTIAALAEKGENVIFRQDNDAGFITSFTTTDGNTFPCESVKQSEGEFSYCRLEYKDAQAVHWLVFVK